MKQESSRSREDRAIELFPEVADNLREIRSRLDEACDRYCTDGRQVSLMAVTKTVPPEKVNAAVAQGVTLLGENRVQEFLSKKDLYDSSAQVHMIGHLQTNKVKYIINDVTMIQSVDSLKLAQEINRQAEKNDRYMDILLEVNIGGEESKSGIMKSGLSELVKQVSELERLRLRGLMAIPPIGADESLYAQMQELFEQLKASELSRCSIDTLSMGMSGDFETAVRYGSTLVRIGTRLFGARDYTIDKKAEG